MHLKENAGVITLLLIPFIVFIALFPQDWFGWLIVFGTYMLPLLIKFILTKKSLLLSIYSVITLHHVAAFVNSYIKILPGATADAMIFYTTSSMMYQYDVALNFSIGSDFYKSFLAMIFKVFGDSQFLAIELSVLAFFISLVVLLRVALLLNKGKHLTTITLFYGFLPSGILFTSVTLRESYQMMFFTLVVYFALRFIREKGIFNFSSLLISLICLSFWHNGLITSMPIIFLIALLFSLHGKKVRLSFGIKSLIACFAVVFVIGSFLLATQLGLTSQAADSLANGQIISYTEEYRDVNRMGGSSYNATLETSSFKGLIISAPNVFLNYMFAPFPWQIRNVLDVYAAFESLLRLLLMITTVNYIRKQQKGIEKKTYQFLFIMYIVMELIWSMGTLNWGTAMRHHLIAYGLILVLGAEALKIKRRRTKSFINNPSEKTAT